LNVLDVRPEATITKLKKSIVDFLRRHPGSTFVELCREVPGFAGSATMGTAYPNLIIWRGVSAEAVRALELLEKGRMVRFEATTTHPYGQEGRDLELPAAFKPQPYDTPHWLPVLVHATRTPKPRDE
jgi:hypothetical protein